MSPAPLSSHTALVSLFMLFKAPVLFLMIQRFVFHFEVVITSPLGTGHTLSTLCVYYHLLTLCAVDLCVGGGVGGGVSVSKTEDVN